MVSDQVEKLEDYLEGFASLRASASHPVGALVVADENRADVFEAIQKTSWPILGGESEDEWLRKAAEAISQGEPFVFHLEKEFPRALRDLLEGFAHGSISVHLAGELVPRVVNPVHADSKVLLIMSAEFYKNAEGLDRLITSVCRL